MPKKKKKKEVSDFLWFANYNPGLVPTHFTSLPQGSVDGSIPYPQLDMMKGRFTPSSSNIRGRCCRCIL